MPDRVQTNQTVIPSGRFFVQKQYLDTLESFNVSVENIIACREHARDLARKTGHPIITPWMTAIMPDGSEEYNAPSVGFMFREMEELSKQFTTYKKNRKRQMLEGQLTANSATTPKPNPTPKTPEVTPMVVAPDKPAPAEMDLTIPRNKWPRIIANTTGHMLAYGYPGTGKSYDFMAYAQRMAAEKNLKAAQAEFPDHKNAEATPYQYEEVNCTRQTSAAGWVGHWIDGPNGFVWNDGPVARAMRAGLPIVINDVHLCSDDLYDLLFFVLDTRPGAKMDTNGGMSLTASPGFRALLSMNGDPHQVLDEPIRDRIAIQFEINMPSKWALAQLDPDVSAICKRLYKNAGPSGPKMTYRTFQAFCKNRRELGDPFMAARLAAGNEQNARALMEAILVGVPASTGTTSDDE